MRTAGGKDAPYWSNVLYRGRAWAPTEHGENLYRIFPRWVRPPRLLRPCNFPPYGDKAEAHFRNKTREIARRSHNLDRNVVGKVNRVIRGAVNYFGKPAYSNLGQFDESDQWIRRRIRAMKCKRTWITDNYRLKNRYVFRMGFLPCRTAYLACPSTSSARISGARSL
uniref:Group II intron, maturase-specific domain n=1 Tax=Candidatus Kentrum sp. TC TaxID=2126339 RepID=A0A451A7J8_9GAMM|nr:MAG: Group II intron, maturase-specific domain [Candidatus Kentron sp. TC]